MGPVGGNAVVRFLAPGFCRTSEMSCVVGHCVLQIGTVVLRQGKFI